MEIRRLTVDLGEVRRKFKLPTSTLPFANNEVL